ncbi:MAG: hypothetical protein PHP39_09470, partial [Oscillospiraceae bacterium]|nr:hypothetical protein [Oscillospiraceae bacterium]
MRPTKAVLPAAGSPAAKKLSRMAEESLIRSVRQQVASGLRLNAVFPCRLVLAISGGLDSVCLLDILQALAPQLNFTLGLA